MTTHRVSSAYSVVSFTRMWIMGRAKMRPATRRTHVEMNMFMNLWVATWDMDNEPCARGD